MNYFLKAAKARYAVLKAEAEGVQTRAAGEDRNLTIDELASIKVAGDELRALQDDIDAYEVDEKRTAEHAAMTASLLGVNAPEPKGLPSFALNDSEVLALHRSIVQNGGGQVRHGDPALVHHRATVASSAVGGNSKGDPKISGGLRRIDNVVGLVPLKVEKSYTGLKFPVEASSAATAEGSTKVEAGAPTALNLTPACYSRWNDISTAAIRSNPGVLAGISQAHERGLSRDFDKMVIAAMAAEDASPAVLGFTPLAGIRAAQAQIEADIQVAADVVVLNPVDFPRVMGYTAENEADIAIAGEKIGAAYIYVSNEVAANTAYVCALREGMVLAVGAEGMITMADRAPKTNVHTVLTEAYWAVGFSQAGACIAVDITGEEES